jgi:L-alanine-DL-glutamate epimerase-like enolase superfamily enzyme
MKLEVAPLHIPLKTSFKQASFTRLTSESLWVRLTHYQLVGIGEGTPRSYVTNETVEGAVAWVQQHSRAILNNCRSLSNTAQYIQNNKLEIEKNPAAWCAVELALLDLFARQAKQTVEALLGIPETTRSFNYTAVLSDDDQHTFTRKIARFQAIGFEQYKIKASGNILQDTAKFKQLEAAQILGKRSLRIDLNNFFGEHKADALAYLKRLPTGLVGVEEPLAPKRFKELSELSVASKQTIILDESCTQVDDVVAVANLPGKFMINLKVSKVGGVLRGLEIIKAAQAHNIPLIIGAHVGETSVLTRAGMLMARAGAQILTGHEGGFGEHLLERDVVEPVLQLGSGGAINLPNHPSEAGWGLKEKP